MSQYGVTNQTSESSSNFIQVDVTSAIAAGRFIKDLSIGKGESGNPYFEVTIVDRTGATAARRYFEPTIDGNYIKDQKDLDKTVKKLNAVIANLARRFRGETYVTAPTDSFESYIQAVIKDIKSVTGWDKKELRIKVILNTQDYPTLPSYAPIFEDAAVPLAESKLKITRFDRVTGDATYPDTDPGDVDTEIKEAF